MILSADKHYNIDLGKVERQKSTDREKWLN